MVQHSLWHCEYTFVGKDRKRGYRKGNWKPIKVALMNWLYIEYVAKKSLGLGPYLWDFMRMPRSKLDEAKVGKLTEVFQKIVDKQKNEREGLIRFIYHKAWINWLLLFGTCYCHRISETMVWHITCVKDATSQMYKIKTYFAVQHNWSLWL